MKYRGFIPSPENSSSGNRDKSGPDKQCQEVRTFNADAYYGRSLKGDQRCYCVKHMFGMKFLYPLFNIQKLMQMATQLITR